MAEPVVHDRLYIGGGWVAPAGDGVIDVAAQFEAPRWPWLVDEVHPSQQGQELWAATVAEALGG